MTTTAANKELLMADATTQAARLASGEISSVELTRGILGAIEQRNPALNCYIEVDADVALLAAQASDERRSQGKLLSAFDGLAFAAKDNIDVRGFATRAGLGLELAPAENDAPCVRLLREAGCIALGKLNMHAAAVGATNHNLHFGDCFNPLKDGYTPGGSSGGSACAVAAGLAAFTLGTDTMGSVRLPAAYCGVAGIKAGRGAVSIGGTVVLSRLLDNVGPLARSARDLATILPLMASFDGACAQSVDYQFMSPVSSEQTVRLGVATALDAVAVEPDVRDLFAGAIAVFGQAGAHLEDRALSGFNFGAARRAGLLLGEADLIHAQQEWLEQQPNAYPADLMSLLDWARGKSAIDMARAEALVDDARVLTRTLLAGIDYLLLPTTPQLAFPMTDPVPVGQADLTAIANFSGYPAITVPMGVNALGLPGGLQLLGRPGSELDMLALGQWFMDAQAGAE
jgi:Asp-tRNA(Asn)/Glu-tRNA(Gln) amidotransferase A subunit family amidase